MKKHTSLIHIIGCMFIFTCLLMPYSVGASGMSFVPQAGNPVFIGCEPSLIMSDNGTGLDCWYSGGESYSILYYTYADISDLGSFHSPPTATITDIRFPTVVKDEGMYYLFASKDPNGQDDIWLWNSSDKINWTPMNGGFPIMYQTADADSQWHTMWNCGVVVVDHVFHMFVECATHDGTYNQNGVRLGYTHGTIDKMDWMVWRTQENVIDKGGSPCPIYVPDRNAIMLFYSTLNTTISQWHLSMATASLSSDLSASSSWYISERFRVLDYNNGADPAFCVVPNGQHNLVYLWFHGQPVFNDIYQEFSDATLNAFFDSWGQPVIYGSGPSLILAMIPFLMAAMLALVFSVISGRKLSMTMFLVVFAMMLCILAALNAVPVWVIGIAGMMYVIVLYMTRKGEGVAE